MAATTLVVLMAATTLVILMAAKPPEDLFFYPIFT